MSSVRLFPSKRREDGTHSGMPISRQSMRAMVTRLYLDAKSEMHRVMLTAESSMIYWIYIQSSVPIMLHDFSPLLLAPSFQRQTKPPLVSHVFSTPSISHQD
jgi:hypothetical protein